MDIGIGLPNTLAVAGPTVVEWARRAEEVRHEPGVDDRDVDVLHRLDEGAVVGPAETEHDRGGVGVEQTGAQAEGDRGRYQGGASQECHAVE